MFGCVGRIRPSFLFGLRHIGCGLRSLQHGPHISVSMPSPARSAPYRHLLAHAWPPRSHEVSQPRPLDSEEPGRPTSNENILSRERTHQLVPQPNTPKIGSNPSHTHFNPSIKHMLTVANSLLLPFLSPLIKI